MSAPSRILTGRGVPDCCAEAPPAECAAALDAVKVPDAEKAEEKPAEKKTRKRTTRAKKEEKTEEAGEEA